MKLLPCRTLAGVIPPPAARSYRICSLTGRRWSVPLPLPVTSEPAGPVRVRFLDGRGRSLWGLVVVDGSNPQAEERVKTPGKQAWIANAAAERKRRQRVITKAALSVEVADLRGRVEILEGLMRANEQLGRPPFDLGVATDEERAAHDALRENK